MHRTDTNHWPANLALLLAMLLWGSSFVALKLAFQAFQPLTVIFARLLVASLCCLPFLGLLRGVQLRRQDLKYLALMALLEPCLYFLFEANALANTTASQAGMVTALLPLLVAVAAGLLLHERVTPRNAAGFALAVLGAAWLSLSAEASADAPNPLLGNLLEFLAMVCAAGFIVTLKRLTHNYGPLFLTAVQAVVGSLFYLPLLFLPATAWPATPEPVPILAVLYLGSCVTLGAYALYTYGISRLPATQSAAFVNLIPVFTVILSALLLGERLSVAQVAMGCTVFAGVWLARAPASAEAVHPAPAGEEQG
jgi:drug/metabolite transporter (DMT)-like permease